MLCVSSLDVFFGRKQILNDITFTVSSGNFCSIVGPNGSGKTTTLRALTGEISYSGSVKINQLEVAKTAPADMAIMRGVLPQASQLSFPFTVYEVVKLGQLSGISLTPDSDNIIERALTKVGLQDFSHRYYQELSGGEQQRVQLARVLVQVWEPVYQNHSRVLFLDEPISSLDIRHQIQIMKIARQYSDEGGTVIAVLHDLNLTAAYSDQIILLKSGSTYSQGSPKDVLNKNNLENVYDCAMRVDHHGPEDQLHITPILA